MTFVVPNDKSRVFKYTRITRYTCSVLLLVTRYLLLVVNTARYSTRE